MQIDDRRTLAEILATGPELRIPTAAAQTPIVSVARIRMDSRKSVRLFSGIICDDISEFESYMPSHAVRSPAALGRRMPAANEYAHGFLPI